MICKLIISHHLVFSFCACTLHHTRRSIIRVSQPASCISINIHIATFAHGSQLICLLFFARRRFHSPVQFCRFALESARSLRRGLTPDMAAESKSKADLKVADLTSEIIKASRKIGIDIRLGNISHHIKMAGTM